MAPDPRPTRESLVDRLVVALRGDLPSHGLRAAWQGPTGAPEAWRRATGADDLDVWADEDAADVLDSLLRALPAARVQHTVDPRRLRHTSYAVETVTGIAVVDVTRGDLMVGPVRLVAVDDITVAEGRLTGIAGAADLLVRPLLRGRVPDDARVAEARHAWAEAGEAGRSTFAASLQHQLGAASAGVLTALSGTGRIPPEIASRTRRALAQVTLRPRNLAAAWSQRAVVVPAGRQAGPLGLRTRGVLVVLVGTDGSGKSTVAAELATRLEALGLTTSTKHLGMARGNLPGVAVARRLLGVAPSGDATAADPRPVEPIEATTVDVATAPPTHTALRKAAAWFYAAEYGVRWLRDVRPGTRRGGIVIADRYVYDLRESPWPGSRAARVAERALPSPDVLVLPDAPAEVIHARKPERTVSEQREQQGRFRALLAERPARSAELVVDTSGTSTSDEVAPVVAAVLEALHRH